jgi:glycine hydroxymethyltransferase
VTTRGFKEADMDIIAAFLVKGIEIGKRIQGQVGKQLKDFIPALETDEELKQVAEQVKAYSSQFSIPGI